MSNITLHFSLTHPTTDDFKSYLTDLALSKTDYMNIPKIGQFLEKKVTTGMPDKKRNTSATNVLNRSICFNFSCLWVNRKSKAQILLSTMQPTTYDVQNESVVSYTET